jgi:hypothetical protein
MWYQTWYFQERTPDSNEGLRLIQYAVNRTRTKKDLKGGWLENHPSFIL